MAAAIITGPQLAAHLGGSPDAALCDLVAAAVSDAVGVIVDPIVDLEPWPASVELVALMVGADTYKAATGTGGGYQLDAATFTDVYRTTSTVLRRYEGLLGARRAVGGMAG